MKLKTSRKEALEAGDRFYEGKPCKHCGCTKKYVSNYGCYECCVKRGLENLNNAELMAPYRTKEKINKRLKRWRKENPIDYRNQYIKKYGITEKEYKQLLKEQNGVCKICNNGESEKMLAIDHNHETGEVRGLLCFRCNTALGLFRDDIELLENAKEYLS